MITPVLINRIRWKTYLIFMILLALFVPFVYFCYPETSGLSLEEIDNLFLPEDKQVRRLSFANEPVSMQTRADRKSSSTQEYEKPRVTVQESV